MKPLLSYYGGKQRLAPKILSLMPPDLKCYIEPFCGGAAVFFALPEDKKRLEVLNDKDERLVTFYRVAKVKTDVLTEQIEGTPYSRSCHRRACDIWSGKEKATDVEMAWAVYITIMQGFGNKANCGWGFEKTIRKQTVIFCNAKARLTKQISRLQNVQIECDDALKVISRYDSCNAFFYLDPPYPNTDCGHYSGYTLSDYQQLIDLLTTIKGKFMLSNYPQGVVMPKEWRVLKSELLCSVANGKKPQTRTELLITNYSNLHQSFDYYFGDTSQTASL